MPEENEQIKQPIQQPQSIEDRLGNFLDDDEDFQEEPTAEVEDGLQETQEADEPNEEEAEQVEEEESVSVESLAELAEHIGADVSDLYNLKIPVTGPDGQKTEVTLGEYKDSYRETAQVRAEREKIQIEAEQVRTELQQKAQFLDVAYNQANAMIQAAERQLVGDASGLEQLQTTDPTQYVLKKQQLTDKQSELNALRQQAIQNYQEQQQQVMQQQETQRQQFLHEQSQQLTKIIPEWADEKVRQIEQSELTSYLIGMGVPEQEVSQIQRAAVVDIARKAMLYDKMQKVKPDSKKKVVTIGKKVIKSSAQPKRSAVKATKLQQARKTIRSAKGTRNTNDAVASLLENHFLEDL